VFGGGGGGGGGGVGGVCGGGTCVWGWCGVVGWGGRKRVFVGKFRGVPRSLDIGWHAIASLLRKGSGLLHQTDGRNVEGDLRDTGGGGGTARSPNDTDPDRRRGTGRSGGSPTRRLELTGADFGRSARELARETLQLTSLEKTTLSEEAPHSYLPPKSAKDCFEDQGSNKKRES